ncbi:HdeA/HdeB family chaperone [Phreatobacter stygius]|uniref:HdeA/HdeB family chaperone n=1 Tax=Phreatobacter stygius TaxID=1940610 RepID=UPI001476962E|nr:HdeA/HdeB family chaperone [Phreatobacter stygius]
MLAAVVLAVVLVAPVAVRAEPIDISKFACREFLELTDDEQRMLLFWLHGYASAHADTTALDNEQFLQGAEQRLAQCRADPSRLLIPDFARAPQPRTPR